MNDYCHFCFSEGAFTEPHISMQAMIDKGVDVMTKQGIMPHAQARSLMTETMPRLKRWQSVRAAR